VGYPTLPWQLGLFLEPVAHVAAAWCHLVPVRRRQGEAWSCMQLFPQVLLAICLHSAAAGNLFMSIAH
jgi:hypothetical protein